MCIVSSLADLHSAFVVLEHQIFEQQLGSVVDLCYCSCSMQFDVGIHVNKALTHCSQQTFSNIVSLFPVANLVAATRILRVCNAHRC